MAARAERAGGAARKDVTLSTTGAWLRSGKRSAKNLKKKTKMLQPPITLTTSELESMAKEVESRDSTQPLPMVPNVKTLLLKGIAAEINERRAAKRDLAQNPTQTCDGDVCRHRH